jgi:hypothetical protein
MKKIYFVNYSSAAYPIERLIHCKSFARLKDARAFIKASAGRYEIVRQTWHTNWSAENKTIETGTNV